MKRKNNLLFLIGATALVASAYAEHGDEMGISYPSLDAGFTQDLVGTVSGFMGDIVFATDGDIFVSPCVFQGGSLRRFDLQTPAPIINGTNTLHPVTTVASNAGCGMIVHPDGFIYSNTSLGVVQINATTGAATGLVFGAGGNALGIAVAPNGDIVYVGSGGTGFAILRAPVGGASAVFHPGSGFVDEIVYDPSGLLYLAVRGPFRVRVVNPDGTLNRNIPLPSEPDGMAFHATLNFMITMNINGTITKIDLGAGDAISAFASGGFRHDMSTVGADGCVYNTQNGTRFDNGATSGANSVVRICPGFVPQGVTDTDGDGVNDPDDFCPDNTMIPEGVVPTAGALNPNHWALIDDDGDFDTVIKGEGKGPNRSYTIEDTAGCSCEEIIEIQGLGDGHSKYGCSISAMDDWLDFVNPL